MNALHCQPARFAVAQVARPVAEVFHAAESPGNNSIEWQLWLKLLNALKVLNQPDREKAALAAAEKVFAADPAALERLRAAAGSAP